MLSNLIKTYREQKGISQGELAKRVGVSRQTINALEANKYNPSLELAFKIGVELDVDLTVLFNYQNDEKST